jgi:hypothetical protein
MRRFQTFPPSPCDGRFDKPNRKSTPQFSHQAISASRAKPESARSKMRIFGQRWRMRATMPWRSGV